MPSCPPASPGSPPSLLPGRFSAHDRSGNLGGDLCATNELKHGGSLGRGQAFDASMSNCLEVSFAHEDLDAHEIWIRSQPQLQPSLSWSSKGAGTIERLSG
ncbi:hypothetical protein BDA96_01G271600 [Sorghum bicolor]|uniref:Uncharacterized protein n=1 Tax=Sorghum bicolor TaxID=4558 RepID=A0A921S0A5_SORBI|nr:hypothetical protein BDA96_01G271600 [Sorghum bicolor]